jgi:hypothetical protein
MQLRALQTAMQATVMGSDDAAPVYVTNAPPLSPAARVAIYRHAYVSRLTAALRSTFVKLHQVLGDEVFDAAAADFIAEHPSTTRSIRWFGGQLAAFLQRRAPFDAQPILAELACFEWALTEVFDARDRITRGREIFQRTPPERWGELRFAFHPAVRTLSLRWNTIAVWQALDRRADAPSPQASPDAVHWLLWRREWQNFFRSMDGAESTALAGAMDGLSFAQICERLRDVVEEDQIPLRAAALLAAWADSGILL